MQKAIEADSVTSTRLRSRRASRSAGRPHQHLAPQPPRPTRLPRTSRSKSSTRTNTSPSSTSRSTWSSIPPRGNWSGTLVNALAFRFQQLSKLNGDYRPGIVHRLDRDTRGVILVAKEEQTHRDLGMQFETRKVFKEYIAITQGVLDRDSDYIERRIGHHPHDRIKMIVTDDEDDGKEACTLSTR